MFPLLIIILLLFSTILWFKCLCYFQAVPKSQKYFSLPAGQSLDSRFPPARLSYTGKLTKTFCFPPGRFSWDCISFPAHGIYSWVYFCKTSFLFEDKVLCRIWTVKYLDLKCEDSSWCISWSQLKYLRSYCGRLWLHKTLLTTSPMGVYGTQAITINNITPHLHAFQTLKCI